jgi:tryptophan synthase alpha chain
MPVGVGFGIRDGATAARIGAVADAVVIGSRIIEEIEAAPPGRRGAGQEFSRGCVPQWTEKSA